jgi:hypothetical protein
MMPPMAKYEAQDAREDSPQHGIGHANQPQAGSNEDAEAGVEMVCMRKNRLRRLAHRQGPQSTLQISGSRQPQKAIADIFPLQQNEDRNSATNAVIANGDSRGRTSWRSIQAPGSAGAPPPASVSAPASCLCAPALLSSSCSP